MDNVLLNFLGKVNLSIDNINHLKTIVEAI